VSGRRNVFQLGETVGQSTVRRGDSFCTCCRLRTKVPLTRAPRYLRNMVGIVQRRSCLG